MDIHEHEPHEQSNNDGDDDLLNDIALLSRDCLLGRLIGPLDCLENGVDPGSDSSRHITGTKPRHDLIPDDLCRSGIREDTLQPIPDLDTNLAFLDRHQQQSAVVGSFLAKFPGRRHTMGEFLDRITFERGNDEDSHLIA